MAISSKNGRIISKVGTGNTSMNLLSLIIGKENGNTVHYPEKLEDLYQQQCTDPVIQQLGVALLQDKTIPPHRSACHKQIWSQLCLHKNGMPSLCPFTTYKSHCCPNYSRVISTYLVTSESWHITSWLLRIWKDCHEVGYWVDMLSDIDKYCRECIVCQHIKPPSPASAPLVSLPIGKAWEMVAVDIRSTSSYLLVVQDYMTKWVEDILIPNSILLLNLLKSSAPLWSK